MLNPQGLALVAGVLTYLSLRPGVLDGAIDTYIRAPLQRARSKVYAKVRRPPPCHRGCPQPRRGPLRGGIRRSPMPECSPCAPLVGGC